MLSIEAIQKELERVEKLNSIVEKELKPFYEMEKNVINKQEVNALWEKSIFYKAQIKVLKWILK